MRRIELEFRLAVIAVAVFALIIETVVGAFGAGAQFIEVRELLADQALDKVVLVALPVGGRPAQGARRR